MDCERLDSLAIDLIDPDGSTAMEPRVAREAEEHLAGCARCSAAIERLRGGLRAAYELGLDDPSSLLEARILSAAAAIKPAVPLSRRVARAVSTVGGWAMRPQVAMAAVLVVMVGTSVVLLRGGRLPGAHRTTVTEEGTPVATLEPATPGGEGAPAVIGGDKKGQSDGSKPRDEKEKRKTEPAPDPAKLEAKGADIPAAAAEAKPAEEKSNSKGALAKKAAADEDDSAYGTGGTSGKKDQAPPPPAAPAVGGAVAESGDKAMTPTTKAPAQQAPQAAPTSAPATTTAATASYDDAMVAYKEGRWAAAAKGFDSAAAAGQRPSSSLLYSARSYRAAGSCAQALPRYQKVTASYPASAEAPHGALEGGQCAKSLGDVTTARALFERAKTYPATQKQAESELAALDKPAASPPAPAKAKAAKPAPVDNGY